jgi:hypothetical protein
MLSGDDLTIVLFLVGTAISIALTAMSTAGWRHPVLVGGLFSLAAICAGVGVGWPMLKTVSPAVTTIVNQVATNPVAWFMVLMLGMTASLLLPKRGRTSRFPEQSNPTTHVHTPPAPAPVVDAVRESPIVKKESPRVFTEVTIDQLMNFYKGRTSIQGDALVAAHVGKWIRTDGLVWNVSDLGAGDPRILVHLKTKNKNLFSANFDGNEAERAMHLTKGFEVTIIGQIKAADPILVNLQHCELT